MHGGWWKTPTVLTRPGSSNPLRHINYKITKKKQMLVITASVLLKEKNEKRNVIKLCFYPNQKLRLHVLLLQFN